MSEEQSMESLIDQIDDSMKEILKGDVLEGTVVAIKEDELVVNIGHFADGIISKEELIDHGEENTKVGDVISVYVLNPNDQEGNVVLSQKRAAEIVDMDVIEKAFEHKENITVTVKEVIKGGVIAYYKAIRCFIPGSLLAYRYVENMNDFIGKELEVSVEELDLQKKRIILSRKAVEVEERNQLKKDILSTIEEGKNYNGVITKIMNFGAFVDIGGVEGLIHISELAWNRVKHPSEVVKEGDKVEVYVLKLDPKTEKIGFSLKKVEEDPWSSIINEYEVGDIVEGKVVRLTDFGAFVEIEKGIDGLVHISEISSNHISKPDEVLKIGDKVDAEILKIDVENKKLSLSIKEAAGQQIEEEIEIEEEELETTLGDLFGDQLKNLFKK